MFSADETTYGSILLVVVIARRHSGDWSLCSRLATGLRRRFANRKVEDTSLLSIAESWECKKGSYADEHEEVIFFSIHLVGNRDKPLRMQNFLSRNQTHQFIL
jgi:hypothetical protein